MRHHHVQHDHRRHLALVAAVRGLHLGKEETGYVKGLFTTLLRKYTAFQRSYRFYLFGILYKSYLQLKDEILIDLRT